MTEARRVEHRQTDKGLIPLYATHVVEQPKADAYTEVEHETWRRLYNRQKDVLRSRVVDDHPRGLEELGIASNALPRIDVVSKKVAARTGFTLVAVEGLLPDAVFFEHLAAQRFPVTWWIRRPDQDDYITEPDFFHDMFGHVPLLMNQSYADFATAFGRLGQQAIAEGQESLSRIARLYWFTIEFGLVQTPEGARIYGAGIASSKNESVHSLENPQVERTPFTKEMVMATPFQIDHIQPRYFVLNQLRDLASILA